MVKYYCDRCGKEGGSIIEIKYVNNKHGRERLDGFGNTYETTCLCDKCLRDLDNFLGFDR